jgi:hypothetical protein
MTFREVVDRVSELLRNRRRVSYRALTREFDLAWVGKGINGETDNRINGNTEGEKGKRRKSTARGCELRFVLCDTGGCHSKRSIAERSMTNRTFCPRKVWSSV